MESIVLTLHIIVCVLLVILVLLQAGKEGMGVIFGGGNSSVFGSSGAGGILAKLTAFVAILFAITSLSYTFITSAPSRQEDSVILQPDVQLEEVLPSPAATPPAPAQEAAPATPAKPAPETPATAPAAPVQN